jgi:cobalt-zinc-cadmium efflux system outer membrane protein
MSYSGFTVLVALATAALGGCVAIPADRGAARTVQLVESRSTVAGSVPRLTTPTATSTDLTTRLLASPIGANEAVQLALLGNPRMRELYARLGLSQGEVYDATRLANPALGFLELSPGSGDGRKTTWSIAQDFTGLLFLGFRNRTGRDQALRAEQEVAHEVLLLEAEVREAFYAHAGAQLSLGFRQAAARGSQVSAELAARFHEAGNISLLQRSREEAVASEESIGVRRLETQALAARGRLLTLLGMDLGDVRPRFVSELSVPAGPTPGSQELQALALSRRLDLAALRTEVDIRREQATHASRWRWLGALGGVAEREREVDGDRLKGGGASLELPVFNSGKGKVLRATALSESAAARMTGLETAIRNDIAVQVAALEAARQSVDEYRARLLPLKERVVEVSQREQNFMLIGAFELLVARKDELDTYERYVDAVRDYWVQRSRLASSVGGALPGDESPGETLALPAPAGQPASGANEQGDRRGAQ